MHELGDSYEPRLIPIMNFESRMMERNCARCVLNYVCNRIQRCQSSAFRDTGAGSADISFTPPYVKFGSSVVENHCDWFVLNCDFFFLIELGHFWDRSMRVVPANWGPPIVNLRSKMLNEFRLFSLECESFMLMFQFNYVSPLFEVQSADS